MRCQISFVASAILAATAALPAPLAVAVGEWIDGGDEEGGYLHDDDSWADAEDLVGTASRALKHKRERGGYMAPPVPTFQAVPVMYPMYAVPAPPQVITLPPTTVTLVREISQPCCY